MVKLYINHYVNINYIKCILILCIIITLNDYVKLHIGLAKKFVQVLP